MVKRDRNHPSLIIYNLHNERGAYPQTQDYDQMRIGGNLHFLVDIAGAHVERAAEDAREGQNVVDLVRVIAPAGRDDLRAARLRVLREDLRRRVRAGEDDKPSLILLCG